MTDQLLSAIGVGDERLALGFFERQRSRLGGLFAIEPHPRAQRVDYPLPQCDAVLPAFEVIAERQLGKRMGEGRRRVE